MKFVELSNLSPEDLAVKLASCKEEIGKLNYLKRVGQVDKPHRFKELRRVIARIQTILRSHRSPSAKKKG
jgi:large subunit ribosomal protein L29